jgi:MFS family permease
MIGFISTALTAMPAGMVSDRIGRKASFILGDGVGAIIAVVMITTRSETVLLVGPALEGFFGNLHHTSEAAFMMENSKPKERVHLFSVAGSFRTTSAMIGALVAGLAPSLFFDSIGKVDAYRYATFAGLTLWFLSLIPALMLRSLEAEEQPERRDPASTGSSHKRFALFSDIRHPRRILYFVITSALISAGAGAVVPVFNVIFHEGPLHAGEHEIGLLFAGGEFGLAIAMLAVPLIAARMLKVDAIAITRVLALPFILAMGLIPLALGEGTLLLVLVGASYIGRITIFRMSGPLDDAFNMEVLEARERATSTGMEIAAGGAVAAVSILVSSWFMDAGDYTTPFLIMATAHLVSTVIYWKVFRPLEIEEAKTETAAPVARAGATSSD